MFVMGCNSCKKQLFNLIQNFVNNIPDFSTFILIYRIILIFVLLRNLKKRASPWKDKKNRNEGKIFFPRP